MIICRWRLAAGHIDKWVVVTVIQYCVVLADIQALLSGPKRGQSRILKGSPDQVVPSCQTDKVQMANSL